MKKTIVFEELEVIGSSDESSFVCDVESGVCGPGNGVVNKNDK